MAHISFSEAKNWNFCPFYHKLMNLDKVKGFQGNAFTAFGNAIHDTCEKMMTEGLDDKKSFFHLKFKEILENLPENVEKDPKLVEKMKNQAPLILDEVFPAMEEHFGEYEVVAAEEDLMEMIEIFSQEKNKFKGFIDLVIKTSDGKYHIIDWKTCSWGWDARKRSDPMMTYQLTFYKHFWAKKHNVDPKMIETHFALLKRTAKKDRVEIFRVTSGKIKTQNALKF
jgi:ATP-dependent exoDNAse (exonuclease V) beta subunit